MTTYFHCCPIILSVGSMIEKGNWGRILNLYARQDVNDQLMREYVLENVRQANFPDKPSRLNCIFACLSEEDARNYLIKTKQFTQIIYEVELIDTTALIHIGDYTQVSPDRSYLVNIETCAELYWQAHNIQYPEVVIGSDVKILRRIKP